MTITTHYDNLRVARNAPPAVIKAAYKVLAQEFHPDRSTHPKAAQYMQIINAAYATLSDPVEREKHDRWIAANEPKSSRIENLRSLHRADIQAIRQLHEAEVKILKGGYKFERLKGIVIGLLVSLPIYFIGAGANTVIERVQAKQREHSQQQFNQKKESTMLRN
jgi:curved DNA-binding protein CbpA